MRYWIVCYLCISSSSYISSILHYVFFSGALASWLNILDKCPSSIPTRTLRLPPFAIGFCLNSLVVSRRSSTDSSARSLLFCSHVYTDCFHRILLSSTVPCNNSSDIVTCLEMRTRHNHSIFLILYKTGCWWIEMGVACDLSLHSESNFHSTIWPGYFFICCRNIVGFRQQGCLACCVHPSNLTNANMAVPWRKYKTTMTYSLRFGMMGRKMERLQSKLNSAEMRMFRCYTTTPVRNRCD